MLDSLINLLRKLAKFAGNPQSSDHVVIREELPGNWLPWVESLPFYSTLTEAEKRRLRSYTCTLVENKKWRGLDGFEVTDEVKVTSAAQAALPLLAIEHHFYRGVDEILIHPSTYKVSSRKRGPGAVSYPHLTLPPIVLV